VTTDDDGHVLRKCSRVHVAGDYKKFHQRVIVSILEDDRVFEELDRNGVLEEFVRNVFNFLEYIYSH